MSNINAQNLEVLNYIRKNGVTPGAFPQSGIKFIQVPNGTKIIAENVTDHGSLADRHTGKLIAGRLRVTDIKSGGDLSTDLVTID